MAEENNTDTNDTISAADYNKAVERAQRFEAQVADLQKKLEPFEKVNLTKLQADSEALERLQTENAKNSGNKEDVEALLAAKDKATRDELQPEIDKLTKALEAANGTIHELTVTDKAFSQISSAFNEDTHPFIKDIVKKSVGVDGDNFIVKDKDGKTRYSKGSANKAMSLDEFKTELVENYPSLAKPTTTAGGRQSGTQTNGISTDVSRFTKMTPEQRAALPAAERNKLALEWSKQQR